MRQIQARRSAEGGFTLIEVLIGVSIFAIGMLAVARMQYATVRNTNRRQPDQSGQHAGQSENGRDKNNRFR